MRPSSRIALSVVPANMGDFVEGRYELPAPVGETTVAMKVIGMRRQEAVVTGGV